MLYRCWLSDSVPVVGTEPRRVLLRIYGQIIHEHPVTVLTDSVIFALLSEKGMGPKLYGVFTTGRVEEYVPVRTTLFRRPAYMSICFSFCPSLCLSLIVVIQFVILLSWLNKLID